MKKTLLTSVVLALSISTGMAASIANFTNATEQQNPYAQSNAQFSGNSVALQQVQHGLVNPKVINPLFQYTGESTASPVVSHSSVQVSH